MWGSKYRESTITVNKSVAKHRSPKWAYIAHLSTALVTVLGLNHGLLLMKINERHLFLQVSHL